MVRVRYLLYKYKLTFVSEIHNLKTIHVIFGNIALVERYLINDPVDRI